MNVEDRLHRAGARPGRELAPDFTMKVVASLHKGQEKRPKWKEYIQVKFHKPAVVAATFALALAVGGTSYAAVGGVSGLRALFGGQKDVGNGARVVQVNTEGCTYVDAFNITNKNRSMSSTFYYKINAGSKLTNQQVVDMVQGACEADAEAAANTKIFQAIEAQSQNKDQLVGGYADSVVTAITPSSISVHSVVPYVSNAGVTNHAVDQTYTHIDPNAIVLHNGVEQSMSTLKVGDHVAITYRATGDALTHSETLAPDQVDTSEQTVVVVTRVSQHMSDYLDFEKYHNRDFEEVTPCSATSIGYCTLDQYEQHK